MRMPGDWLVIPDGTAAPDLAVSVVDDLYPADAEILVSADGTTWSSLGVKSDTADIALNLEGVGPIRYVKIDQAAHFIDPAYPDLGFDLNGVAALHAGQPWAGTVRSMGYYKTHPTAVPCRTASVPFHR
jgi:hypothetical protein